MRIPLGYRSWNPRHGLISNYQSVFSQVIGMCPQFNPSFPERFLIGILSFSICFFEFVKFSFSFFYWHFQNVFGPLWQTRFFSEIFNGDSESPASCNSIVNWKLPCSYFEDNQRPAQLHTRMYFQLMFLLVLYSWDEKSFLVEFLSSGS